MNFFDLNHLNSSSSDSSEKSSLTALWMIKKSETTQKVISTLQNSDKTFNNETDYINFLYDECKSLLGPIAKFIDKNVDPVCSKNATVSCKFRNFGNTAYKNKKLKESFYLYTKSIVYAPPQSPEIALAYGNRSAVLFQNSKYNDCIGDIKKCLENPYPENLKYKIYSRLAQCHKHLENIPAGLEAVNLLRNSLEKINSESEIKEEHGRLIQELEQSFQKLIDKNKMAVIGRNIQKCDRFVSCAPPQPTYGTNATFEGASSAIYISKNDTAGRFVVANRDIKRGDILFVEEPYCFIRFYKNITKLCSYCNSKENILISPCLNCTDMMYCSDACRDIAWNSYHRWECNGLISALGEILGLAHLALRILLKGAQVNFDAKQNLNECYGFSENNYACVYNLVTNFDKMNVDDIGTYAVCAVTLVYYLKSKTDFYEWYEQRSNMKKTEMSRYFSSLILKHLCQLQCNAHGEEMEVDDSTFHMSAIYPSASLMNHSCNSNILNEYFNSYLIVRASRDIKKNEEVLNSYGYDFRTESTVKRQKLLQEQYYFECSCEACTNDDMRLYYELHHALKCPKCGGKLIDEYQTQNYKCITCQYKLPESSKLIRKYEIACKEGINKDNLFYDLRNLNLLKECAHKDNFKLIAFYKDIYMKYQMRMKFTESILMARTYLDAIINVFGVDSSQVADKMLDISLVMLENMQYLDTQNSNRFRLAAMETLQFLNATKERLAVYYGPWNEKMKLIENRLSKANALWVSYLRFKYENRNIY